MILERDLQRVIDIALAEAGGRWDLVVLDLLMPGIDGAATFAALRARIPGQRVLLVSGFAPEEQLRPLLDADAGGFLAKPFTPHDLVAAVAMVLAEETPRPSTTT